jgi:hypothetical protein
MKVYKQLALIIVCILVIILCVSHVHALVSGNVDTAVAGIKNYSAIGIVNDISSSTEIVSISNGSDSDGNTDEGFVFNLSNVKEIESGDYTQLSIDDIESNDKIIVQGIEEAGTITISRIIDLSWNGFEAATSTAFSADSTATSTARTTDVVASSTDNSVSSTGDTASSTGTSVDVTATSTASTTDSTASSTDSNASTTDDTATSTDSIASSSDTITLTTDSVSTSTDSSDSTASSAPTTDASTTDI